MANKKDLKTISINGLAKMTGVSRRLITQILIDEVGLAFEVGKQNEYLFSTQVALAHLMYRLQYVHNHPMFKNNN